MFERACYHLHWNTVTPSTFYENCHNIFIRHTLTLACHIHLDTFPCFYLYIGSHSNKPIAHYTHICTPLEYLHLLSDEQKWHICAIFRPPNRQNREKKKTFELFPVFYKSLFGKSCIWTFPVFYKSPLGKSCIWTFSCIL